MQAGNRAEDRGEHQRHDDHLQQLHVAVTDDIKPWQCLFYGIMFCPVECIQPEAEQNTDHQTGEYLFGKAPVFIAAELHQHQQQNNEYGEIAD